MFVFVSYSMRDDVAILLLPDGHIKVHKKQCRIFSVFPPCFVFGRKINLFA